MDVLIAGEQKRDLLLSDIGPVVGKAHLQEDVDLLELHLQAVHADLLEELHGVLDDVGRHLAHQDLVVQQ